MNRDDALESFADLLRDLERVAFDRWDRDEHVTKALVVARAGLRFLATRAPSDADRARIDRLVGAMHCDPARGERAERPWYTVPELADAFGWSRWAMKRWLERHGVPHEKDGRNRRVWVRDLEKTDAWSSFETKRQWRRNSGLEISHGSRQIKGQ